MGEKCKRYLKKVDNAFKSVFVGCIVLGGVGMVLAMSNLKHHPNEATRRATQEIESVAVRDMNGDGLEDVVLTDNEGNTNCFFGKGEGGYYLVFERVKYGSERMFGGPSKDEPCIKYVKGGRE